MVQVKKIEIFGTSFLLGCLTGYLFLPVPGSLLHCTTFLLFCCLAAVPLLKGHKSISPLLLFCMICLCGCLCIFRGACSGLGILTEGPRDSGAYRLFSQAIDRLGFRNSGTTALVKALLLGDKSGLSAEVVQNFRKSGASHILALSGLHLGLVYGLISLILRILGNSPPSRIIRSAASVGFCLFYCIMVGAAPSVSSAMIFVLLREYGKLSRRCTDLRNLLWASFVLHICIAPRDFSGLGFQMSYLAVAGIAYLFPLLKSFYPEGGLKYSPMKKIWESAALSISCQASTWPLARLRFGSTPGCFMLTNLICLPLTALVIPGALILTLMSLAGLVWEPSVLLLESMTGLLLRSLEIIALI